MGFNLGWVLCVACAALLPAERDVLARGVLIPANHGSDQKLPVEGNWVLPRVDPTFVGRGMTAAPLVVDFGETLKVRWMERRVLDRAPGTKPVGFSSIELQAR